MLKKVALSLIISTLVVSNVLACEYTCPSGSYNVTYVTNNYVTNYGVMNYYSNSGSGDQVTANYEATAEYDDSYCHLCGLTWDICTCYDTVVEEECYDGAESSGDYNCDWSCGGYSGSTYSSGVSDCCDNQGYQGMVMAHWANLRDACGNVIGSVDAGSSVEIIGVCEDNPSRTLIYDYCTGTYGTVASVYLYGGSAYEYEHPTEWDCGYIGNYQCEYGSEDTWAADDITWVDTVGEAQIDTSYACDYTYDAGCEVDYSECYDECVYSADDCGMYFVQDGIISNRDVNIKIDLSNSVINVYSGDNVILSGNCDCSGLACGNYHYCSDFSGYCGEFGNMLPNGCEICVRN